MLRVQETIGQRAGIIANLDSIEEFRIFEQQRGCRV